MRMNLMKIVSATALMLGLSVGGAIAQNYPNKPITLILPLGAGGSHDLNSRVFTSIIPQ